ncbi:MAG: AAA family ATPase [Acidimicrobiia bacterium]|nr:AAA family ATPase [Acidimicrobiia bacterium]
MLTELHVENLGIIDDVTVALGPGLTTVTGETGAGKTLLVVALGLIAGSRADASMVRSGAPEARVEARFVMDGAIDGAIEDAIDGETAVDLRGSAGAPGETELVLTRVVAAEGRSRAYMNGRLVTAGELAACTEDLLVHHGQHSHQALLHTASQRDALDAFAGAPAQEARREVATALAERRRADERIAEAGSGDRHALAREIDLLRFQVAEIAGAAIDDPDEIDRIATEHELLTGARELRATLSGAYELLETTGGDAVGEAAAFLSDAKPFAALHQRALALQAELQTLAHDLRDAGESIVEDDARLSEIDERRRVLHDLTRKYGASLADVVAFGVAAADRLDTIENLERAPRLCGPSAMPRRNAQRRQRNAYVVFALRQQTKWPARSRIGCASSRCRAPRSTSPSPPQIWVTTAPTRSRSSWLRTRESRPDRSPAPHPEVSWPVRCSPCA